MLRHEEQLRRDMAMVVEDLRVPPVPVDAVVWRGRARRRRKRGAVASAAFMLAALPTAGLGYAVTHSGHQSGMISTPSDSAAPAARPPARSASQPIPAPPPLPAAELRQLGSECARGLELSGRVTPFLSARTAVGGVALIRVGGRTLSCWTAGSYSLLTGQGSRTAVTSANEARPVRKVDAGGDWDGRVWSAVLRVAPNIASATVVVDGGTPQGVAISDGWAAAAAVSGKPRELPRVPRSDTEEAWKSFDEETRAAQPVVRITAFDKDGRVVWKDTSKGGYFGWVSATHPNH